MQPWDFLLIRSRETRGRVKGLFDEARGEEARVFDELRRSEYLSMKLEGIMDAPLNLCVTCDSSRGGPQVLGRSSIPETDVYSTCLAVQNLWLAARAEGVGVGWVSILRNAELREILGVPPHVTPVAYLCLGYPEGGFAERPLLESNGWVAREDRARSSRKEGNLELTRDKGQARGTNSAIADGSPVLLILMANS